MNKEDRKDLVERLRNISRGDHERGCQGREYVCSCDYDETSWKTAEEAASEIDRLRRELEEARKALEPFANEAAELAVGITDDCVYALPRFPELGLSGFDVGDLRRARAALRAEEEAR
ncbi:hypothetical protein [Sinorhizobium meliloti]|uniref:hypothetical protein n=1 Tax=Rhizobium meliloti TaxID=382 RepID=UPI00067E71F8|nr:hypothetical protein [Sinorhizobium meliloti]